MGTESKLGSDGWGYTISIFITGGAGNYFKDGDIDKGAVLLGIASAVALASYGFGLVQKKYEHH